MGWEADPVYGFSEIYLSSSTHNSISYFLDVNTEIEVLKATVIKVVNKPQYTLLSLKLIYFV